MYTSVELISVHDEGMAVIITDHDARASYTERFSVLRSACTCASAVTGSSEVLQAELLRTVIHLL